MDVMKRYLMMIFLSIFATNTLYAGTTPNTNSAPSNTAVAPTSAPYYRADTPGTTSSSTTSAPQDTSFTQADIERFATALQIIRNNYVDTISNQKIFDDALRGVLNGLDPHSSYLDADDLKSLNDMTSGEFTGLGIEVTPDNGYIKVVSPIDGSPADKAGLKPGDIIVRINNILVKDMDLSDAVKMMRGKKGTTVNLMIVRKGTDKPFVVTLTRDDIRVASVKEKLLDGNYGYVRISLFQSDTAADLATAIEKLQKQANGKMKGLIIDLRNDPGGLLDAAVGVVNELLDPSKLGSNKLIVFTKSRVSDSQLTINADSKDLTNGIPIVVLINGGSASASEIVAGALQDHQRALIVGTKSFGKGSVQTVIPLGTTGAIKLTTALYFTPSGRSIQAQGIVPDVVVENLNVSGKNAVDEALDNYTEADLQNHLANGNTTTSNSNVVAGPKGGLIPVINYDILTNLATKDYQLYEALNLLKGMATLQTNQNK